MTQKGKTSNKKKKKQNKLKKQDSFKRYKTLSEMLGYINGVKSYAEHLIKSKKYKKAESILRDIIIFELINDTTLSSHHKVPSSELVNMFIDVLIRQGNYSDAETFIEEAKRNGVYDKRTEELELKLYK